MGSRLQARVPRPRVRPKGAGQSSRTRPHRDRNGGGRGRDLSSLGASGATVVDAGTERDNLHFSVHPTVNNQAKIARVAAMLAEEEGAGIIYTASIRSANELHDWLKDHGVSVGRYHGKMRTREREQVQAEFMRGDHKVMIATKAFGLGIDKADIRYVYHFEFPDSIETYYQEAGRAGRDGLPSKAVLLYRLEDKRIQSFFLAGRYPRPEELRAVLESMAGRVLSRVSADLDAVEAVPAMAEAAGEDVDVVQPTAPEHPGAPDEIGGSDRLGAPADAREGGEPAAEEAASEPALQELAANGNVVTPEAISQGAGVGRRRTQVILHLLRQAGLIRRGRRGYTLKHKEPPSDAVLEDLLKVYEDRANHDRDRLGEMMHYAESVDCRVQMIRAYFSEGAGERCGRCDNCKQKEAMETAAEGVAERAGRGVAMSSASAANLLRSGEARDRTDMTCVETMHGTIYTTAPETLPKPEAPCALSKGMRVNHNRFGAGKVKDVHDGVALVQFTKGGDKRVKIEFLASETSPQADMLVSQ